MKKIVRLTEQELKGLIKRVVSEMEFNEDSMMVNPFTLSADRGNIKITNTKTNQTAVYKLQAWKGIKWWDCTVEDFPDGDKMQVSALGMKKVLDVNKNLIRDLLQKQFGRPQLEQTLDDGQEIKFTKVG